MDENNNQNFENHKQNKSRLKVGIIIGAVVVVAVAIALIMIFVVFKHEENCEHEWTERTCVNGIYCTKCDQVQIEYGYGHNFSAWKKIKNATLDENGVEERKCNFCDETETKTFSLLNELTKTGESRLKSFHSSLKSNLVNPSSYTVNAQIGHIFHDKDSGNIYLMLSVDYSAQNKSGGYNRYSRKDYFVWREKSDGTAYWEQIDDIKLCLKIMNYEFDQIKVF